MTRRSTSSAGVPAAFGGAAALLYALPLLMPVPILAMIMTPVTALCPTPLVLLYRREGARAGRLGVGLAVAMVIALFAIPGLGMSGYYFLYFAALGLVLGEATQLGLSETLGMGLAAACALIGLLGLMFFAGYLSGDALIQAWQHDVELALGLQRQMGLGEDEVRQMRGLMMDTGRMVIKLGLAFVAIGSLLSAWINHLLARALSPRLAPNWDRPNQRLSLWQAPDRLIWFFIASCGLVVVSSGWPHWLGLNLIAILGAIYFLQGVAILAYWLDKKEAPAILLAGIFVLIGTQIYLALLVAAAGLFDMWFNFRKLDVQETA